MGKTDNSEDRHSEAVAELYYLADFGDDSLSESGDLHVEMGSFSNPDVTMAIQPLSLEEARDLFYQLGVPRKTLDSITAQYSSDTCKEQLVQAWLDSDADASWDKFFSGLQFISSEVPSTACHPLAILLQNHQLHLITECQKLRRR